MSMLRSDRRTFVLATVASVFAPSVSWAQDVKSVPRDHGPQTMEIVNYPNEYAPGTIVISNADQTLHRLLGGNKAERYKISVGRDGFLWTGTTVVGRKATWPGWTPPGAMRQRDPSLPEYVPPGPYNPLGARALYLFSGGRDTLYRIHGTNNAGTIGNYETSGCFRMTNADVMSLYNKVPPGTKVVVK
ncbi:L,D-transpeptidase [Celeribacter litoreus]|uniref:L,D-transpeptidase n=1 Tax=Celeribacter litoreus TaxID=2876714 RepID=UPI001CCB7E70|nr:L,D-transpeptidase [Celeribacter litoreus]